jgi:Tfp pilus assembly protein PilF
MLAFFFFAISFIISFAIIRPISVVLHELGHGIPALFFTKGPVTLLIGTYDDLKNTFKITIGRLTIYFKINIRLWGRGLAKHDGDISRSKNAIILIGGPACSLLIATIFTYIIFAYDLHGSLKLISIPFLISAIIDFFVNIIPDHRSVTIIDGHAIYNDGFQLVSMFKKPNRFDEYYNEGVEHLGIKNFETALVFFNKAKEEDGKRYESYAAIAHVYMSLKQFDKALETIMLISKKIGLTSTDFTNLGYIKGKLKNYHGAIHDLTQAIKEDAKNSIALNNRGFTYNLIGKYKEAIIDFNKAIEINPEFAYSYNNRGLAKIKLNQTEEGLKDIEHSLELDSLNSYAYRNLGIYHYDKGDYSSALKHFVKSYELDKDTHEIEDYMKLIKEKLNLG